ncbi:MAG: di-trans,poly-cis-decaprenylcistransferase [Waddliaceae bacterium]|nr:di-trans,poly-cis-decaprenylcistransferase [Waddliaceae bacterium]
MSKSAEEQSRSQYFSEDDLAKLELNRIPRHVAIIPDGNRRWAEQKLQNLGSGHEAGADVLIDIVSAARDLGIKILTVYGFSTENWLRSEGEVSVILSVIQDYLTEQCPRMVESGIRLETIGDLSRFSDSFLNTVRETKQATEHCKEITLVLALNYGGRDEICRATKRLAEKCATGSLDPKQINEEMIREYMDSAPWPDPDLFIRTSGEYRISNYLLWQMAYTEIHIEEKFWPSYSPHDLLNAVIAFQSRNRRFGE